jgi:AraC-like DNA-binding protein
MSQNRRTPADEPFLVVRSSTANPAAGAVIANHAHDWHQLIHIAAGVITVWTEDGTWVAPPHWAIWAPAGVRHGIRFTGKSALRTLYFRADFCPDLPARCSVVAVSPLLRELILHATARGMLDRRDPVDAALATLLIDAFAGADVPPFDLPQPATELTRRAAARFGEAGAHATTACVAEQVGIGARTLERRFVEETGMSCGRWRQQRALLTALEHLAAGLPVKVVAASVGYATPSAFVAAFRGVFGTTPGRYFDVKKEECSFLKKRTKKLLSVARSS